MKREILLERIDKLKQVMPWYVLEYYQSKLAVPYSFTTLYEYLKEYDRFFTWVLESGISDADHHGRDPFRRSGSHDQERHGILYSLLT